LDGQTHRSSTVAELVPGARSRRLDEIGWELGDPSLERDHIVGWR
jgi:hypothetical protein